MNPTIHKPLTAKSPHKKQVVTRHLRELAATLTPGTRLPSVNELERTFGYANSTIEAAFDELRREGIIVRRQGSGTFVADGSEVERKVTPIRHTRLITVAGNTRNALYQVEMLHRIEAELQMCDMVPILVFESDARKRFERIRQYAEESHTSGFFNVGSTDYAEVLDQPGIIIGEKPDNIRCSQVVADNVRAGQLVGEYLWKLGHRKVLFLTAPSYGLISERRMEGLCAALEAQGGTGEIVLCPGVSQPIFYEPSAEPLRRKLEPLFLGSNRPTAIFGVDDAVALQAIRALHLMGLRIPEDISVIGFNDCGPLPAQTIPSLTTVRMPCAVLVSMAVQLLQEQLQEPGLPPRSYRIPAEITIRETVGIAPGK